MRVFNVELLTCLIVALTSSVFAQSAKECFERAQKTDAVQLWYINGVPHTDANGNQMMKYTPGKSFFPIGLWGTPGHEEGTDFDWKYLKELHVNTIWGWGPGREKLDLADRFNVQVIFNDPIDEKTLKDISGHKRLLGNAWKDEPIGHMLVPGKMDEWFAQFQEYKKKANQLAPSMVVFINDSPWINPPATEWSMKWNTAGDVECHDNYPIDNSCSSTQTIAKPPRSIPQTAAFHALINRQQKPVWMIVSAHETTNKNVGALDDCPCRYGSAAQLRAMVYASLIHGATGIHYFIWDAPGSRIGDCLGMSRNPRFKFEGLDITMTPAQQQMSKMLWNMAGIVNAELEELSPVLLSPTVNPKDIRYTVKSKLHIGSANIPNGVQVVQNPVRTLLKTVPNSDELIMLSANMDAGIFDTDFKFDRPIESLEILFNSKYTGPKFSFNYTKDRTGFSLRYEAFDVHVIKIKFVKKATNGKVSS